MEVIKDIICRRLDHQLSELRKMEMTTTESQIALAEGDMDRFTSLATDAALRSEALTCKMRHLLYQFTDEKRPEHMINAAEMQGMVVREYKDMFEVELPCLLPKRNTKRGSEFITDPMHFMLERYNEAHPIKRYESAVVCFVHEYDRSMPCKRIIDYDNMEQKAVVDVIATFFLRDDSGRFCDTYNTIFSGDAEKTGIYIMSQNRFLGWYSCLKCGKHPV